MHSEDPALMDSLTKPLVSFVVPSYNYARYLGDCLDSIFAQEGDYDFEVIVIDDGSTDNTRDVLSTFRDARLRTIIHTVNQGHAATINEGLREARGEFIARIDPDDRYRSDFLVVTMPKFQISPRIGMVYGDAALINEHGEITQSCSDVVHAGRDFVGNELVPLMARNYICAPTVIARRDAWLNSLPVPKNLAFNDWYFTLMMARNYDFYYVAGVLADYRVHASNHHTMIVRNRTEEPSIFWMLNTIYSKPERHTSLETAKQQAKRKVYGTQYLDMANKYFGYHFYSDSRRCYAKAIAYQPQYLLRPDVLRHLLGTLIGRTIYEACRSAFNSARMKVHDTRRQMS